MILEHHIGELCTRTLRERQNGRCIVELTRPLTYRLKADGIRVAVTVPRGFKTDYASIPHILWSIMPPDGPWVRAAVIHDYLYQTMDVPRWLCDAVFRSVMQHDKVPLIQRLAIFYAVRIFGRLFRAAR